VKIMPPKVIDNTSFPSRRVGAVRAARNPGPANLAYILTLECGHTVGLKKDVAVPATVPCYDCHKETKH